LNPLDEQEFIILLHHYQTATIHFPAKVPRK